MAYAVYHCEKGSSNSGGIGNHIDRKKGMEHTFRHADPQKARLNRFYKLPNEINRLNLSEAISKRIEQGYNHKRKIRTDAVKFITHILTGSHEQMKAIFENDKTSNAWIQSNFKFLAREFGKDNIVRFVLHLDEKTPHIHAVTVPLTADGRLSAKEVIGNKTEMQQRQDRYAELMQPYGLERGLRNTGIKHESAQEYYKRMNKALVAKEEDLTVYNKSMFGSEKINVDKTIENYKEALTGTQTALQALILERKSDKEKVEASAQRAQNELKSKNATKRKLNGTLLFKSNFENERKAYGNILFNSVKPDLNRISNKLNLNGLEKDDISKLMVEKMEEIATKKKYVKEQIELIKSSNDFNKLITQLNERKGRDRGRGLRM
jgi:hypothetical protein